MDIHVSKDGSCINCIIDIDELFSNGFNIKDIEKNIDVMNNFFDFIFDNLYNHVDFDLKDIVNPVRMIILDDGIELKIRLKNKRELVTAGGINKEISEKIMSSLLNLLDKLKEQNYEYEKQILLNNEDNEQAALLTLDNLEYVIKFSKQINLKYVKKSELYKFKDKYYIHIILDLEEKEAEAFFRLMLDYASRDELVSLDYLKEHGNIIMNKNVIENLRTL